MRKKERYEKVIAWFQENVPVAETELHYNNPYELLIAVILSAQCTDVRVNQVTKSLFIHYPDAYALAEADFEELCTEIHSCGCYSIKEKNLIDTAKLLCQQYEGNVPPDMEELVKLPGVGRKSANLIMGDVYGKPAIVTDTHCIRLCNRIGLVDGIKDPKKVEMELWKIIPPEESNDFCHRLVDHGRAVCTARTTPHCDMCVLNDICGSVVHN